MARSGVAEGMPVDLSLTPPKCDHCILGKQTRSSVPKEREGGRAVRRLERVFVDLCGPMSIQSRSGRLYSMNVIDDYSSYVWSLPLKSKDEACPVFIAWHKAVSAQSNTRLCTVISDNGELVSRSFADYCASEGITHLTTAPHTSAQNGRAERLHRTLLDKARSMRLSCGAPPSLWDEFCATAAYLTNLTGSAPLRGKTPFELWFGRPPSLSHLREIGCRAFALIPGHHPKILARSLPCRLIGYAPHSKAYRLWDPATHRILNSFHVSFIEHLDESPSPLLPGTVVGRSTADAPPSWDTPSYANNRESSPLPSPLPSSSTLLDPLTATLPVRSAPVLPTPTIPSIPIHPVSPSLPVAPAAPALPLPVPAPSLPDRAVVPAPPTIPVTPPAVWRSSRIPVPAPRGIEPSSRLAAIWDELASAAGQRTAGASGIPPMQDTAASFLCLFQPLWDTHDLFPVSLSSSLDGLSVEYVLLALSEGSISVELSADDDPSWEKALASPEQEYWIAGARDYCYRSFGSGPVPSRSQLT
jgi:hypothetical protein